MPIVTAKKNTPDSEKTHWQYYLMLEKDFLGLLEYCALSTNNYDCYSNRMTQLLLSICSEVENVSKLINKRYRVTNLTFFESLKNIMDRELENRICEKDICDISIESLIGCSPIYPFSGTNYKKGSKTDIKIEWWHDMADLKHDREKYRNNGNLKNVYNSLSALFFLESLLIKIDSEALAANDKIAKNLDRPVQDSSIFSTESINYRCNRSPEFTFYPDPQK